MTEHRGLAAIMGADNRPGVQAVLATIFPSQEDQQVNQEKVDVKQEKQVKVKQEAMEQIEVANAKENKAEEKMTRAKARLGKVKVKQEVRQEVDEEEACEQSLVGELELEEASEEDVDDPGNVAHQDKLNAVLEKYKIKQTVNKKTNASKKVEETKKVYVVDKVEKKVETKNTEIQKNVEGKKKLVVAKKAETNDEKKRGVVASARPMEVDRVHQCLLCSDRDGRGLNLGRDIWDLKYHYAVCYYNQGAMFAIVDPGAANTREA